MPTILLLDASLSMTRPVTSQDSAETFERRQLAINGITTFLEYLSAKCKLEFVSLFEFSSSCDQTVAFTRDFDLIKDALNQSQESVLYNKTCIERALGTLSVPVVEEWGIMTQCQVVLITDGDVGVGPGSLKHSLQSLTTRDANDEKFPLPYPFPCKLHILCLATPGGSSLQTALPMYQRLVDTNNGSGEVYVPEGPLGMKSVQNMFTKLTENYYSPFHGVLKCGNLKCNIHVFPAPEIYDRDHDFEHVEKSMSRTMEICGFLDISDIASPPFISRHLVLPFGTANDGDTSTEKAEGDSKDEDDEPEEGKMAAFTVLLHGSLKVEGMVALTQLGEDWFGVLFSFADNKKKSNLMLSILTPGVDILPWLGQLDHLAPIDDFSVPPYGDEDNKSPFPIRPTERRSYAQNCVVWIKASGIQADIQKILRNARKLPEKQQHFYKELNRLRKAALSFGFLDLLEAVAQLLQRECTLLPGNAHPDAALQLTHAANMLTSEEARDVSYNITPMRTYFTGNDQSV